MAPTLSQIIARKYTHLLAQTTKSLDAWTRLNLAWFGRIAAVKMTVLPRILYTFQMLSLTPPPGALKKLQGLINKFVWGGKKPRIALSHMFAPKARGGLALPSVMAYYQATALRFLVQWNRPLSSKHWDFMDEEVAGTNIWRELWLPRRYRAQGPYISPITGPTMRVWDRVALPRAWTSYPSPMTPILDNPDFPPGKASPTFHRWREQGCKRVGSLFDTEGLIGFSQLRQDYGLLPSDVFPYSQLAHWVTHHTNFPHMSRFLTPFELWVMRKADDRRLVSELYARLIERPLPPRSPAQIRWETELGRPLKSGRRCSTEHIIRRIAQQGRKRHIKSQCHGTTHLHVYIDGTTRNRAYAGGAVEHRAHCSTYCGTSPS